MLAQAAISTRRVFFLCYNETNYSRVEQSGRRSATRNGSRDPSTPYKLLYVPFVWPYWCHESGVAKETGSS